jgi:hypothetical protein
VFGRSALPGETASGARPHETCVSAGSWNHTKHQTLCVVFGQTVESFAPCWLIACRPTSCLEADDLLASQRVTKNPTFLCDVEKGHHWALCWARWNQCILP